MELQKSEGVILHSIKYRDFDQILTVFTQNEGLLKCIVKNAYSKKMGQGAVTALFTEAEFIYSKQRSEICLCHEVAVKDSHIHLRDSLSTLEAACEISKAITQSQMLFRHSPQLYNLLCTYLKRLPNSNNPSHLPASFQLKLLRHDGTFGLTPYCGHCNIGLEDHYIAHGQSFCSLHSPIEAVVASAFEAEALFVLAFSRSFAEIEQCSLDSNLKAKIQRFFLDRIHA